MIGYNNTIFETVSMFKSLLTKYFMEPRCSKRDQSPQSEQSHRNYLQNPISQALKVQK